MIHRCVQCQEKLKNITDEVSGSDYLWGYCTFIGCPNYALLQILDISPSNKPTL